MPVAIGNGVSIESHCPFIHFLYQRPVSLIGSFEREKLLPPGRANYQGVNRAGANRIKRVLSLIETGFELCDAVQQLFGSVGFQASQVRSELGGMAVGEISRPASKCCLLDISPMNLRSGCG